MKIKEFIEKVNEVAYAKKDGDCIYICDGETTSYQDYYFLAFLVTSKSMDLDWEWRYLRYTDACKLRTILNLVKELQDTPVKDRFSEKRYYLRWIDDKDGNQNYIEFDSNMGWYMWGDKNATNTFTNSQLEQLKKDYPRFASIIDVMKEEVKDDDGEEE
ncbi:hypothetical protein [Limosilactobacillus reuteri]|uniref:hypothetical protein n=1 Tax=Limosilactobacillus reuteri TaxID=1598 RepID=UPI002AAAEA3A|nr:hypothetical protein [Limosilactobacillus reuteri]WPU43991.1 hypothetical protein SH603_07825 [Limosilactobacillus reuteri]